jgi:hypothetical protein
VGNTSVGVTGVLVGMGTGLGVDVRVGLGAVTVAVVTLGVEGCADWVMAAE